MISAAASAPDDGPQRVVVTGSNVPTTRDAVAVSVQEVGAEQIAAEARAEWGFASDLIARAFRAHRELGSGDRRLCSETVYGLIRMDRRLDAILEELTDGATLSPHARD